MMLIHCRSHENITLLDATRYSGSFVKLSPLVEESNPNSHPNPHADPPPKNYRHSGHFLSPVIPTTSTNGMPANSSPSPGHSPNPSPKSSPRSSPRGSPPITPPFGGPASMLKGSEGLIPDPNQAHWQSVAIQPVPVSPTPRKKSNSFTLRLSRSKSDVGKQLVFVYYC